MSFAEIFSFAKLFVKVLSSAWSMSTLFAVISDLVVVDGIFIMVVTLITMTVGAAPDACGRIRNLILQIVPEAVKDHAS